MKNKKGLLIFLCIIICIIAFIFIYFVFINKDDNFVKNIFDNKEPEPVLTGINDNYNGVYVYTENKGKTINAFDGCTFSYVSNYIVVNKGNYKIFRSSCLGTFFLKSGLADEFKFEFNEKTKLYDLVYDDKYYVKDLSVRDIFVESTTLSDVRLEHYKTLLEETKYYSEFKKMSAKIEDDIHFSISFDNGLYNTSLISKYNVLYNYSNSDINALPDVDSINGDIIIYEKNIVNGLYNDKLYVFNTNNIKYNLMSQFPIYVDGVSLDYSNSILLDYNVNKKKYVMYVGYNESACSQSVSDDYIVYYKFDLEYDYYNKTFKKPYFIEFGKGNNACKTMKDIVKKR